MTPRRTEACGRKFHPLANIIPEMQEHELAELTASIKANGLREPIVLLDDQILDGRHRAIGCEAANVEPAFRPFLGDNPITFVIDLNVARRHLDESQRAMVAANLAAFRHGGDRSKSPIGDLTQEQAAILLNVGKRSVERAADVREYGTSELQHAVEAGKVSVSAAADVATLPVEEQREIVARGERQILEVAKAIRAERVLAKRTRILAARAELAYRNVALPVGQRKYGAVYADPPWPYTNYSELGKHSSGQNHYPVMEHAEIEALPVEALALDDCALFLWATMPQLPEALRVIEAWGFTFKTAAFVWVKQTQDEGQFSTGMGNWTRSNAELCLLATRGSPHRLNADVHQVVLAPRMEHSRKPEEVAARIERLVPGPYIELFARRRRPGWECWGFEAPEAESVA